MLNVLEHARVVAAAGDAILAAPGRVGRADLRDVVTALTELVDAADDYLATMRPILEAQFAHDLREAPLEVLFAVFVEHSDVAVEEGWAVFESTYGYEIERDDDSDAFQSDDAAENFVRLKAQKGSPLHRLARAIHDRQLEWNGREAAHEQVGLPTERAAWELALRDLQERED